MWICVWRTSGKRRSAARAEELHRRPRLIFPGENEAVFSMAHLDITSSRETADPEDVAEADDQKATGGHDAGDQEGPH